MITGHNTDVRYGELVLHVQTEDKGKDNPYIESLIYFGGQVVVAKRASYAEQLADGTSTEEITALIDRQHRMMIKAIQAGKFDDKISKFGPIKTKQPETSEVTTDFDFTEDAGRTLDQVILEYLTNEAEQEQLVLVNESEEFTVRAGGHAELRLRVRSSKSGQPMAGTKILVKMISTFGGPRTLGSGETDGEGLLAVPLEIPAVEHGTAALIINASGAIGQAELKYLL
jgi:hypothetical protein